MAKVMQVPFYLYRQHDIDLINLYKKEGFSFQKEIKKSLIEYANGRIYKIELPDGDSKGGYIARSIPVHISLDPKNEDEKKAIYLLKNTRKGFRCQLIKAIFRISLASIPLSSFAKDGNGDGFIFRRPSIFDQPLPSPAIANTKQNQPEDKGTAKSKRNKVVPKNDSVPDQVLAENVVPVPVPVPQPVKDDSSQEEGNDSDLASLFSQMDALTH